MSANLISLIAQAQAATSTKKSSKDIVDGKALGSTLINKSKVVANASLLLKASGRTEESEKFEKLAQTMVECGLQLSVEGEINPFSILAAPPTKTE